MPKDWYPSSMDATAAWFANLIARRPEFEVKYPILSTMKTPLIADNDWLQYWVQARHAANALGQQLTKYFNSIGGNDTSVEPPEAITWALPGGAPAEVPPGIEKRIRDIRREVVNQADYAVADGEALGFEADQDPQSLGASATPEFTLRTLANFELEATFRKFGMDALRFEFRHKGGNWMQAGFLMTSPGTFTVTPLVPGEAGQIEVRAFFIQKNNVVGNPSDAKTAFIAP